MNIPEEIKNLEPEMKEWRRWLHAHPETAYEERGTADFVAGKLESFGLSVHRGLAGTGVIGTLEAGGGRTIALRADMDALPLEEKNDFAYRSALPGRMHACGHDGHVAMLLGAARYLARKKNFKGTVHFIFQPAEEGGGGAERMIKEGLFSKFPCEAVYGLHNWPDLPLGRFGLRPGPIMASSAKLEIELSGHGCHAAMPHTGVDIVLAASALVQGLHTIISRNTDPLEPAVLSVTQVHAGDAYNIIPGTATLRGTVRAFDTGTQDVIEKRIKEVCDGVCAAYGARAEVQVTRNYPPTVNNGEQAAICAAAAGGVVGGENVVTVKPVTGSEDFSFMLREKPGCYVFAGSGPVSDGRGLHNPRYDFNDGLLPVGAAYWASLVLEALRG